MLPPGPLVSPGTGRSGCELLGLSILVIEALLAHRRAGSTISTPLRDWPSRASKARIRKPGRSFPVSLFRDGIEHRQLPQISRRLGRCSTRQKIATSVMPNSAVQRTVRRRISDSKGLQVLRKEKDTAHGLILTWQGELSHWQRDSIAKYFNRSSRERPALPTRLYEVGS